MSAAIANIKLCNVCKMQILTVHENFTGQRGLITDIHVSCTNCAKGNTSKEEENMPEEEEN